MAPLIVSHLSSLDGFLAGPGGDLSRLPMGPAFDAHNLGLLRGAGTLLFGRTTFELFRAFWPQVGPDDDPVLREIAALLRGAAKLVVSDTLVLAPDEPWAEAEVVGRAAARDRIARLKAEESRPLLIYGSATLWNELLAQGLVDELHLLMGPVVLGAGVPVFAPGAPREMTLLDSRLLPGSQIVALRYAATAR
jgi:dihydrofolate reductase